MKWWYLRHSDTFESAVVYAENPKKAFDKLLNYRKVEETDFSRWESEELDPNHYDGILYFY